MPKHSVRLCIYVFMTLFCMAVIFAFSAQNANESQALSDGFLLKILSVFHMKEFMEHYEILIRKLAHFFLYFVLGVSAVLMFYEIENLRKATNSAPNSAFVLSIIYAASDEIHQYFVPGRSMQFSDVVLDSAGALSAIIFIVAIRKLVFKQREERKEHEQTSSTKKE